MSSNHWSVCLVCQAAELLRHAHLQPYVLKVNLKLNSPKRSSLTTHWPESDYMKKTRFSEPVYLRPKSRDRRLSYGNDRTLNPSISLGDQDSPYSTKRVLDSPHYLHRRMERLSINSTCEESPVSKTITSKPSNSAKNLRFTTPKTSSAPKKRTELSKGREMVRSLHIDACITVSFYICIYDVDLVHSCGASCISNWYILVLFNNGHSRQNKVAINCLSLKYITHLPMNCRVELCFISTGKNIKLVKSLPKSNLNPFNLSIHLIQIFRFFTLVIMFYVIIINILPI